ncbi:MAG: 3-5 exoribonuclease [Oceanotoga sp.]|uniref:3'-5' exoribonuclease n=1 Tax=Oceanotoga teriensis TaxID=515440 RepID=A0AA45HI43_9BACT|nr:MULTISPECIES: HD domain-containing protein [Oceanotoga]MDN5342318.1 3-5 exoribonuclease [Oceanotoga sp.]PWJ88771.1 3'-5' exoribonuclease [Oceanotoga teriensis]
MNEQYSIGQMIDKSIFKDEFNYYEFIKDIEIGKLIEVEGKVVSKKLQNTKDGKVFLLITIKDKTESLRIIDWFKAEDHDKIINIEDIIKVRGKSVIFENRPQINLDKNYTIEIIKDVKNQDKYIKTSNKNINTLINDLNLNIEKIKDPFLKKLTSEILLKDKKIHDLFIESPAAITVHHAYKNGLLEHTLKVLMMAENIANNYEIKVDKDLIISGALLHDLGKIYEYKITNTGIEKTENGELLGHIAIGLNIINSKLRFIEKIDFIKLNQLNHIILSHHGEIEYGSPILPKTIEAFIIHYADNIDSKIAQISEIIENNNDINNNNSNWSFFDKRLGRKLMIKTQEDL